MDPLFHEGFPDDSPAGEPEVLIVYPKPGRRLDVVILGRTVFRCTTHFDRAIGKRGRSVPCPGLPTCAYCRAWQGGDTHVYLACCLAGSLRRAILGLSDAGQKAVRPILTAQPEWRGTCLRLERADSRVNARQMAAFLGRFDRPGLREDFDPRPHLIRSWGMSLKSTLPGAWEEPDLDATGTEGEG